VGAGTIKNLDLRNLDTPIEEVRSCLAGRYGERREMNPTLLEQTVASVFRDLGYCSRATGCTGDGGIDVILQDSDGFERRTGRALQPDDPGAWLTPARFGL
jgi:restriction endonuclease Mrr